MMFKVINIFMLVSLLLSLAAFAQLRDPTRPPGYMNSDSAIITTWQLDAVIIAKDRKIAIINGQSIKIGEKISTYQLIDIQPNSVQLQGANDKITLFLLDNSFNMDIKN
jgi:MSHA biogenesis protein MshK